MDIDAPNKLSFRVCLDGTAPQESALKRYIAQLLKFMLHWVGKLEMSILFCLT